MPRGSCSSIPDWPQSSAVVSRGTARPPGTTTCTIVRNGLSFYSSRHTVNTSLVKTCRASRLVYGLWSTATHALINVSRCEFPAQDVPTQYQKYLTTGFAPLLFLDLDFDDGDEVVCISLSCWLVVTHRAQAMLHLCRSCEYPPLSSRIGKICICNQSHCHCHGGPRPSMPNLQQRGVNDAHTQWPLSVT